ncbi:MAG: CBS domain-containing protein, partial [Candidatus Omnitrophica bacterium]|nr:CBS domain-containing protein [Candidatus Omnitrophota bacterium]
MKRNGLKKRVDVVALFLPELKELIAGKNFNGLKQLLKTVNSMDLAEGWGHLESTERIIVFKLLTARKAVELFENLTFRDQEHIINNLDNQEVANIINEMAPDERADLFKELPEKVYKKLLLLINKEEARDITKLMDYKEGTAGSLMTTEFVEVRPSMTARQALVWVQENLRADYRENIYSICVTDESHKLIGSIPLQDLLKAPPDMLVRDAMLASDLVKIDVETDSEDVSNMFEHYDLFDAPVVDKDNTLLGVITVDDIVETIEKETTAEMYEIGKMSPEGGEARCSGRDTR